MGVGVKNCKNHPYVINECPFGQFVFHSRSQKNFLTSIHTSAFLRSLGTWYRGNLISHPLFYWLGGHFCQMQCDLLEIYCAPRIYILGREYTDYILLRDLFFQASGSSTSLKSQTGDPQLDVPPGGLVLRIFTFWKTSIDLSRIWTLEPSISRRARYHETTEADNIRLKLMVAYIFITLIFLLCYFLIFINCLLIDVWRQFPVWRSI